MWRSAKICVTPSHITAFGSIGSVGWAFGNGLRAEIVGVTVTTASAPSLPMISAAYWSYSTSNMRAATQTYGSVEPDRVVVIVRERLGFAPGVRAATAPGC